MRMMFGLLALLITVAIILVVASMYYGGSQGVAKTGKRMQQQATQISGRGPDKVPVTQSITYVEPNAGDRLDSLEVASVTTGGAMEAYGVQAGDTIVEVNGMAIRDVPMGDVELARAWVAEAYQRQQTLVVLRNGQRIELPQQPAPGQAAPRTTGGLPSAPGGGAPAGSAARGQAESLVRQIEQAQKPPPDQ
jgi:membrane-associated protease RseP (regulator of RpoE activity)